MLDLLFEDVKLPMVSPVRVASIERIWEAVREREDFWCTPCRAVHKVGELMEWPREVAEMFWGMREGDAEAL